MVLDMLGAKYWVKKKKKEAREKELPVIWIELVSWFINRPCFKRVSACFQRGVKIEK